MKMKKLLSLFLAALMITATLAAGMTVQADLSFNDTDGHWGKAAIEYVVDAGLMNGVGDGSSFAPDMSLTRGMVVTVLYRDNGSPKADFKGTFLDVAEGAYYTAAAEWAFANNIVNGTGTDEWGEPYFSPDRDITRQELATMFKRYADFKHVDTTKGGADISTFPDAASVADWATDAVKWAVGVGLITGKGNGGAATLSPVDKAVRAEFATIIKRFKESESKFEYHLVYKSPVPISTYTEPVYDLVSDADIYVAVDGNDKNDGSINKPLASFEAAKAKVRELKTKKTSGEIKVAFKSGCYNAPTGLEFTSADSGNDKLTITYCAYGDGDVKFSAGVTIPGNDFTVITDAEQEMFPAETRDSIKKVDLAKYGIDVSSLTEDNGFFAGTTRMDLARWPNKTDKGNDDFIDKQLVASINSTELSLVLRPKITDRINTYHNIENMYMLGYYNYDWSYSKGPVIDYDPATGTIKPSINGYGLGMSREFNIPCFYFYNIPDELDRNDEYYIDQKTGYLYVIGSTEDYTLAMNGQMFTMNSVDHVRFVALDFCYGTDKVVQAENCNYITFDRCNIHNMRGKGIYIKGNNITITSCEFYDVGSKNVEMISGDRNTLTLGNSVIENCLFDKFGSVDKTGNPAIYVWGCGIRIAHNEICNSSNIGIFYSEYIWASNYILIEYNYLHNVVTQTNDSGAIYGGRNPAGHGSVVRYNLICDIGDKEEGYSPHAIYLDDYMSGQDVYGNLVFAQIFMHGGRENKIHNNVIIEPVGSEWSCLIRMNDEEYGKVSDATENFTKPIGEHEYYLITEQVPFRTGVWAERFPTLAKVLYDRGNLSQYKDDKDFFFHSSYNELYDNTIIADPTSLESEYLEDITDNVLKYATKIETSKKYTIDENPYFVDPTHGDYTVRDGVTFDLPFEKMGRY